MPRTKTTQTFALASFASPALHPQRGASVLGAYTDFILSSQAMNCTPVTMSFYRFTAGMRLLHLQAMGGWEDPEMIEHYAQMVDEDLLREHRAHFPVDNL